MTTQHISKPEITHSEAKTSLNTMFVIDDVQWHLTMREGTTAEETLTLLREAYRVTIELTKAGAGFVFNRDARESFNVLAASQPRRANGNGVAKEPVKANDIADHDPAWCPIHQCEMKRWEKDNRAWYSHKAVDGTWCKGQPRKKQ